jgi:hypothetical protein
MANGRRSWWTAMMVGISVGASTSALVAIALSIMFLARSMQ